MKMVLVRGEPCYRDPRYTILGVEFQPNWLERLFGSYAHVREYRGDCSVWYELPKMTMPSTRMCLWLHEQLEWLKYHHPLRNWRYGES